MAFKCLACDQSSVVFVVWVKTYNEMQYNDNEEMNINILQKPDVSYMMLKF